MFVINDGTNGKDPKVFTLETMRGNIRYFKKIQTAIDFIMSECKKADYLLIKKDGRIFKVEDITPQ